MLPLPLPLSLSLSLPLHCVFHWCPNIGQQEHAQWEQRRRRKTRRQSEKDIVDGFISAMETMLAATFRACQHIHSDYCVYVCLCVWAVCLAVCANIVNCLDGSRRRRSRKLPPPLNKNNLHNMSTERVYAPLSSMREFMAGLVGIHKYLVHLSWTRSRRRRRRLRCRHCHAVVLHNNWILCRDSWQQMLLLLRCSCATISQF